MKKSLLFLSLLFLGQGALADLPHLRTMIAEMEGEMDTLVGGAVAMIADNKLIYTKTFGHREASGPLVNDQTLFSLASVSKAIVATAMGALSEKGVVNFNDTLKVGGQTFTLKEILSHTTGYTLRGDRHIEQGLLREGLLDLLKEKTPQNYTPKKPFAYSNLLYSLNEDYMAQKGYGLDALLQGLGCGFKTVASIGLDNLAYPYSKAKKRLGFPSKYQKVAGASAGVFASINGMTTFLNIVLGNRPDLIGQKTLEHLFKPATEAKDVFHWTVLPFPHKEIDSSYGLGWRGLALKGDKQSAFIYHPGFINGVSCFVGVVPAHKAGIVILLNQNSRFAGKNGLKFWKAVLTH